MLRILEMVWLICFLAGLLLLGVFGTWAQTAPFWYGAGLICLAGVGTLISRQGKLMESPSVGCLIVMALLGIYLGWRGMTSEVKWLARQDMVFAGTALVVYGLMAVRITSPTARLAVLGVLFLLVAGNTGLGLYQYFKDPRISIFSWLGLRRGPEISAGGFFESGNHFAGFLTLAGLPLLGVAVLGQGVGKAMRGLATLGFLLAATGVAFSTSRGGGGGFLVGMGVVFLVSILLWQARRQRSNGQGRLGWWLLALAVLFPVLLGSAGLILRKTFTTNQDISSLNGRGPLWDAALEQWQTSPIIGTGARSYEYMERGFRTMETKWMVWAGEVDAIFAHNDYLQCLGDYGLTGLGLVLLVAALHLWRGLAAVLRSASGPSGNPGSSAGLATGLTCGAVAGIAGIMVQALVEFNLHIGINAFMTGLLLGIMATPGFRLPPAPVPAAAPRPRAGSQLSSIRLATGAVVAAISILLLEAGWRMAPGDIAFRKAQKMAATAANLTELIAVSGLYQKATSLDPDNPKAWHQRGMTSLAIASMTNEKYAAPFYEASLTQLDHSLELYPKNPYAAAQAGKVAGYLKRLPEAQAHFNTALQWGANIQSVNESYGDYLMQQKDYFHAIGYLITAWELSDNEARERIADKRERCLQRLKQQGVAAPPEAFIKPGKP